MDIALIIMKNKKNMLYSIKRQGKTEELTTQTIKRKKADALEYSEIFQCTLFVATLQDILLQCD